ncbi:bromodomain-containing protein 4-like [Brienomyrus brachyistius]|uniref:bromodomain-containing protein 4-like n=1 Tax=Brienomyrus brachyistius TaxID=42636 RepID=UPI0020B44D38|nr:bromodomain-containing protein 4-like [Brienomyrus brachyistius]
MFWFQWTASFCQKGESESVCDQVNRKTGPVSSSTLRWRTLVDVEKLLQQITDDSTKLTDCQITEGDLGHVSGEFFEKGLNCFDWETYDVRMLKSCDPYFEAQQRLNKSLSCSTSDLQEEEEIRPKRKPKAIHLFGDSDDDTGEEDHQRKRARGRPKPPPQPPAPAVPPPPFHVPSSSTVVPPPPTPPLQTECRRPTEQQTPSASRVPTPNWPGGRYDTSTIPALLPKSKL